MDQKTIREKARELFDKSFNNLNFELLKAGLGDDYVNEYIERPSDKILEKEAKDNFTDEEWKEKNKEERENAIQDYFNESEHYPMWSTIFEERDDFISDRIMSDIDELYKIGIGVIRPTDYTNACLFIAGAGYDFYDAHWIPLFKHWEWLKDDKDLEAEEIMEGSDSLEEKAEKLEKI